MLEIRQEANYHGDEEEAFKEDLDPVVLLVGRTKSCIPYIDIRGQDAKSNVEISPEDSELTLFADDDRLLEVAVDVFVV